MKSISPNALLSGHWSVNILRDQKAASQVGSRGNSHAHVNSMNPVHSGHGPAETSAYGSSTIFPMGVVMFAVVIGTASVIVGFVAYRYLAATNYLKSEGGNKRKAGNSNHSSNKGHGHQSMFSNQNGQPHPLSQSQTSLVDEIGENWTSDEYEYDEDEDEDEIEQNSCRELIQSNEGHENGIWANGQSPVAIGYENSLPDLADLQDRVRKLIDAKSTQQQHQSDKVSSTIQAGHPPSPVNSKPDTTLPKNRQLPHLVQQEFIIGHGYYPITTPASQPVPPSPNAQQAPPATFTSTVSLPPMVTRYPLLPIPTSTIEAFNKGKRIPSSTTTSLPNSPTDNSQSWSEGAGGWDGSYRQMSRPTCGSATREPVKIQLVTCLSQDADVYYENEEDDEIFL